MKVLTRRAVFGLSLALAACGNDGNDGHSSVPDPATLCVSNSCGSKTVLLTIPDAENLIFTNSGRLFVSGGTNVFEISEDSAGAYVATPIMDGTANFTGLAIIGNVLYANAFDGQLYAAELTAQPQLRAIHDYDMAAPNGLVDGPDGELYAVNGPIPTSSLPAPKIVRVDLDPSDPFKVTDQTTWFTQGLLGPNGLQRRDRTLYVSNTGLGGLAEIRTVEIAADGSAGAADQLLSFIGLPDDFSLVDDHLLVANFLTGEVMLYDGAGLRLQGTAPLGFSFPSMVRTGQPPLFANTDIVVTEKGILGDNVSPIGNVLSVFRATP